MKSAPEVKGYAEPPSDAQVHHTGSTDDAYHLETGRMWSVSGGESLDSGST